MQRTALAWPEESQTPSPKFVALYAVLVVALLVINVAGYGLIALTV
jgi:hypothetical protein